MVGYRIKYFYVIPLFVTAREETCYRSQCRAEELQQKELSRLWCWAGQCCTFRRYPVGLDIPMGLFGVSGPRALCHERLRASSGVSLEPSPGVRCRSDADTAPPVSCWAEATREQLTLGRSMAVPGTITFGHNAALFGI